MKFKLLIKILNKTNDDTIKTITLDPETLKGTEYERGERRVGNVRANWFNNTISEYWDHIKKHIPFPLNFETWSPDKNEHRNWLKHAAKQNYIYAHQFFAPMYGPPQHTQEEIDHIRRFRTWLSDRHWLIEGLDPDKEEDRTELQQRINNLNKAPTTPDWYQHQLQIIEEIIGTESQDLDDNDFEEELHQNNTLDDSSEET